jgi:hypothetical protein
MPLNPEGDGPEAATARTQTLMSPFAYLLPMVATPLLLITAGILIIPGNWFAERSGIGLLPPYGDTLRNADCQILVYGDSAAMSGANPDVLRQRTGLTSCNIAEIEGMTMFNGTGILDHYLAQNRRPRFLVFLFAPEDLNPASQFGKTEVSVFEGITYRLRQPGRLVSALNLLAHHPREIFDWSVNGLRTALAVTFVKDPPQGSLMARRQTLGLYLWPSPQIADCKYPAQDAEPDREWIKSLRSTYDGGGTTVLVDTIPLPACDPSLSFFQRTLAGVTDNPMESLPVRSYSGFPPLGRHVTADGSVLISNLLANQILARLQNESGTGKR